MNRLALNGIIVGLAIGTGIALSLKPWQVYQEQKAGVHDLREKMTAMERERTQLSKERATLANTSGREAEARRQGFLKKGEVSIAVAP